MITIGVNVSGVMHMAPVVIKITEEMRKARQAALLYSGLVILLTYANKSQTVKFIGLDVQIDVRYAFLFLLLLAVFYLVGFYVESGRAMRATQNSEGLTAVQDFNNYIESTRQSIANLLMVQESESDRLRSIKDGLVSAANEMKNRVFANTIEQIQISSEENVFVEPILSADITRGDIEQRVRDRVAAAEGNIRARLQRIEATIKHDVEKFDPSASMAGGLVEIGREVEEKGKMFLKAISQYKEGLNDKSDRITHLLKKMDAREARSFRYYDIAPPYVLFFAALTSVVIFQLGRLTH